LTVGITNGNVYTNINNLVFDSESGFSIDPLDNTSILVGMNSTFKYWQLNGNTMTGNFLTAQGLDTVNFISGNGITMSLNAYSHPQSITISTTVRK
jgi:hypothetical protein